MELFCWCGKALRVNLSSGVIKEENIGQEVLKTWLGGRGLGARMVAAEVPAGCDPLGEENKIIFAAGPLTGTKVPGTGRFSASAKSPLTGTIFDSNAGGRWGVELKRCGYDALIIEGKANAPACLTITGGRARLEEAGELWGAGVAETNRKLAEKLGKVISTACIGPAGENLVKFAAILCDGHRALGRGGLGAVMGAKRLKAITLHGTGTVRVASPDKLNFMNYEAGKWIKANPITSKGLPEFGTPVLVNLFNEMGVLPTRNFQFSRFAGALKISGEAITETMFAGRRGCYGCPVQCAMLVKTSTGITAGPEYESVWALGPQCGIDDLEVIVEANRLCNDLGLDTISTGVTIGCAMELAEKGFLKEGLNFGDGPGLLSAIRRIAFREGTGNLMAEGSRYLAGNCMAPGYAMQAKGLELPAYDPRGLQGMGLALATSNRGGCHLRAYMAGPEALGVPKMVNRFSTEGKAGLAINQQNIGAAADSLAVCRFINLAVTEEYFARILSAATGVDYRPQDLYRAGERIWNLERLYNLKAGLDSSCDTLPPRLLEEPVPDGPSRGKTVVLKPMLEEYYRFRGWDRAGRPTRKKIQELQLEEFSC
ncbi:MAG: aldehyde ferredoxin oxidoreductase family protein [Pelotomaculum sp.]|uniref:Aldehyde:ferredoxin oxidoreductase n=1 Tax=Pelotomaculum thermopropionicum (strain DSM 13744 / JCM 10971 / SI) TaxID=370438 RepID=A5D3S9_PELTS|nr:aldehyde ferredoxin oxidoreductase family protein [Pelotomaculum sp.]BAF59102.1 aldehyde:ferredoxin oxidoreductase [Pelotomaculum thermopropionicum SI]